MRNALRYAASLRAVAGLLCVIPGSAAPAPLEAPGRVVAVTVFRDRAQVEREVELDLPAGLSRVSFVGLSAGLERDSLRVSVTGPPVVLGAVEVLERGAAPEESQEVQALRARLARLQAEVATLDARDRTSGEQQRFLGAVAERAVAEPRPQRPALDVASIDAFYRLMGARLEELSQGTLARAERRTALKRESELAEGRLASLERDSSTRQLSVAVEVEAEAPGARTLRLEYIVFEASWQPTYRATFEAASGEVTLISEGVVSQRTGEDWVDVSLRLSTATPARGLAPAQLAGLWIRRPRPAPGIEEITVTARRRESSSQHRAAERAVYDTAPVEVVEDSVPALQFDAATESERRETEVGRPANAAVARNTDVERSEHSVSFRVPGRSSVPADGRAHRVPLRRARLRAELEHRVVPAASESAYVVAHALAPDYPLLAGPLRAYATGAYLGSLPLPETAPGAKLDVPFGVDDRVRVRRTRAPVLEGSSGLLGRQRQVEYRFVTRIENGSAETRTIVVEDRLPVSEDERVGVEIGGATSPGWRTLEARPGILEWPIELEPGGTREIVFGYRIRFPEGLALPRL